MPLQAFSRVFRSSGRDSESPIEGDVLNEAVCVELRRESGGTTLLQEKFKVC